jgi:hypothetical protein
MRTSSVIVLLFIFSLSIFSRFALWTPPFMQFRITLVFPGCTKMQSLTPGTLHLQTRLGSAMLKKTIVEHKIRLISFFFLN